MSIGADGFKDISVKTDDPKNNLKPGQVLQLTGPYCSEYVIVKVLEIDERAGYGRKYLVVNTKDLHQSRNDAYLLAWKADNQMGIHTYIDDKVLTLEETDDLYTRSEAKRVEQKERQVKAEEERKVLATKGRELFLKHIPANAKSLITATYSQKCVNTPELFLKPSIYYFILTQKMTNTGKSIQWGTVTI